jgi:hypothetical protein
MAWDESTAINDLIRITHGGRIERLEPPRDSEPTMFVEPRFNAFEGWAPPPPPEPTFQIRRIAVPRFAMPDRAVTGVLLAAIFLGVMIGVAVT